MNQQTPWAGFKYEPVPGLINRHISRFLRSQRKNIRRMLAERGHTDLLDDMVALKRDPTLNFMQKNKRFQRIMNEYIARTTPVPAPEAAPAEAAGDPNVGLPAAESDGPAGAGTNIDTSVPAVGDVHAADPAAVIE